MLQVCSSSKCPQIAFDIFSLGLNSGHIWDQTQALAFIDSAQKFKVYNEDVLYLVSNFVDRSSEMLVLSMVKPYLDKLAKNDQVDYLLFFFDRTRLMMENKKYQYDDKKTAAENSTSLKEFENEKYRMMKQYLSDFVSFLVANSLFTQGELLYKNILEKKWLETHQDYLNGMVIYNENPMMFDSIYKSYKENESITKSVELLTEVLKRIQVKSILLVEVFTDIMDKYILSVVLVL